MLRVLGLVREKVNFVKPSGCRRVVGGREGGGGGVEEGTILLQVQCICMYLPLYTCLQERERERWMYI